MNWSWVDGRHGELLVRFFSSHDHGRGPAGKKQQRDEHQEDPAG